MQRLSGKVTIISGGTRGMGAAMVRGIVAEGGTVVFGGRDQDAGFAIEAEMNGYAFYSPQDVAVEEDWAAIVRLALDKFGAVHGLVNNAGLMGQHSVTEVTAEDMARIVGVNQIGVMLGIKHVVPAMRSSGGGSIVNIGSISGVRGSPNISLYCGAKAAVGGISRAAALELAPSKIRVNLIRPGFFATQMLDDAMGLEGHQIGASQTPLGRVALPQEIVGPVTFLLSDESSFVTGADLAVDGGLSC